MPILRSVNQDRARSDVIEGLTESVVLLERNWAMKFLPMIYREFHSKLFGKRELNWHISVGTYCSRMAVHIKRSIRKFLNEGNDITKSFEFFNAVTKTNIKKC